MTDHDEHETLGDYMRAMVRIAIIIAVFALVAFVIGDTR